MSGPLLSDMFRLHPGDEGLGIIMRYEAGGSLLALLHSPAGHDMDTAARLRLLALSAHALADIHLAGVVHADIKPDNILLSGVDHPSVTDRRLHRWQRCTVPVLLCELQCKRFLLTPIAPVTTNALLGGSDRGSLSRLQHHLPRGLLHDRRDSGIPRSLMRRILAAAGGVRPS
ncbi:unnamed protein product [Sphagnum balticum]